MSKILFLYKIAYNVVIGYTTYQLVYGLHPLMPTKYIMPIASGNEIDNIFVIILINKIQR
jgi:hypothetical protein